MSLPDIIGISGTNCSGKDTLAGYLAKNFGYTHISTGDICRDLAMELYGNIERETLQKVGPEYKTKYGAGVFVELALKQPCPVAICGIRSMGELKVIKKAGGVMVFINADAKLRYDRMKKRARDAEANKSFKEFMELDEREIDAGPTDADFKVGEINRTADIHLDNSGDLDDFLDSAIQKLEEFSSRVTP